MLQLLIAFYKAHPTQVGIYATWLVSLVIGQMPAPNGAGRAYQWLYGILQGIGANIKLRGGPNGPPASIATTAPPLPATSGSMMVADPPTSKSPSMWPEEVRAKQADYQQPAEPGWKEVK